MTHPFVPAARLRHVQPSATLALAERARNLRASGLDVVSLTAGEPDFIPAPHVIEAAHRAMLEGRARYTAVAGMPELRAAVAERQRALDGVAWQPEEVVITTGAKQAIACALAACLDPGDEVVILAPYWLSYLDMTYLHDGRPVVVPTSADRGFVPDASALERAITPRTRVLILNSPSNPAGSTYDDAALAAIAEVLRRQPHLLVLLDDIYRRLSFGGPAPALMRIAPDLASRAIVVDGCSKTYAMTGYRLGWACAPRPIAQMIARVQGQTTSSAPATSQFAALAALGGDQGWVDEMVRTYDARRAVVIERLRAIEGVRCFDPRGAFYAFPDVSAWIGRKLPGGAEITDAGALVEHLLSKHLVATVPGGPFGMPGHLRLSFATDMASLEKGLARIREGLASIR